jgi:hypothetical protein
MSSGYFGFPRRLKSRHYLATKSDTLFEGKFDKKGKKARNKKRGNRG